MSGPIQRRQPGHVVQCASVRDVIERYSGMAEPYSMAVWAEADNSAVLRLVASVDGLPLTVVADASWLATLWRMRPGDRRPTRMAALTAPLEAQSRIDRLLTDATSKANPRH
ncbi:hypothetical protein KIPE111705_07155 [Kibdelosporangium persicum]|uniref:Uncharacterized protein n=1 Tax=Kibdelosporangium persicum TaxID=2698649 RepID=A0ABX2FHE3_9PSEU|nr:hypothetical protein [Kibdelosporangium persicum]NRN70823.1 hypothetical protein [Kibdelosporangium persicum]